LEIVLHRRSLAAFVVVLGAACGCRSSAGITGAPPPPSLQLEEDVKLPAGTPAHVAAAIAELQNDHRSKGEVQLPETALRWSSPCNRRVWRVWSYYELLLRLDLYINICGDSFLLIGDGYSQHWLFGRSPW